MWSGNGLRTLALVLCCVLPAACGFQPMYAVPDSAAHKSVAANYADIEILNIPDRDGQYLRNALIDRLYVAGRPASARYALEITPLQTTATNQAVRKDATYTRSLMEISTLLRLRDRQSGDVVLDRPLRAQGSYNLLDNQFATIASRDSLNDRLLEELADSIQTTLALHFRAAQTASEAR
ncbi:MAG: LPS assembly lipoprotein LptE [Alphaproteobacteria bacterium]|nr:LPS assembly lipoprotein LptE [Alphaproteobacteria bacterium]